MAYTVNFQQCDYLRSSTTSYVFASEPAELVRVNQQISSLDSHISQLNTLRNILHRRSCQLHNLLHPVRALPVEVLSYIFKQVIDSVPVYGFLGSDPHRACLRQALVLSSVTTHFRYVAFATPELWRRIPLALYGKGDETIGKASALLRHCIALASNVDVSISDKLKLKGQIRSAINTLLDSDTMRKIKALRLNSAYAPKLWIDKLKFCSLPMFDTLTLTCDRWKNEGGLDLGALNRITRFAIKGTAANAISPFIVPPSVQHLKITDVPQQLLVSVIYQCPNLEECTATVDYPGLPDGTKFTKPLILNNLKRLTFGAMNALETNISPQNFRLPSLEYLHIDLSDGDTSLGVISLCRNVSATLTTLNITLKPDILNYADLYQLCRLPFPKLKELDFSIFGSCNWSSMLNVVRALTPRDDESSDSKRQMLPSLNSLRLYSRPNVEPSLLLDMLKKWRVGETSHFCLNVSGSSKADETWSPELREELRLVVGSRRVEVKWNHRKLLCIGGGVRCKEEIPTRQFPTSNLSTTKRGNIRIPS